MESIIFIFLIYILFKMYVQYGVVGFMIGLIFLIIGLKYPKFTKTTSYFCAGIIFLVFVFILVSSLIYGDKYSKEDIDSSILINQGQNIESKITLQNIDKNGSINNLLSLSKEYEGVDLSKYKDYYWSEPSLITKGYSIHGATLRDPLCNKINEKAGLTILPNNTERLSNDKLTGKYGCSSTKQMFYNVGDFYK